MKNDFFAKKNAVFPATAPFGVSSSGCCRRLPTSGSHGRRPSASRGCSIYRILFFYQTFSPLSIDFPRSSSRRTHRLPSPREVGVRCPLYIIGVKQSADCLHSPLLRPFLPTDAVSRSKRHRGTLETPYPGPKQILRRWKCRIFNQKKHFETGYDISLTFINILALDTSYP